MRRWRFFTQCLALGSVTAMSHFGFADTSLNDYLALMAKYPSSLGPLGDVSKREIEIILDRDAIANIEAKTGRRVGIVAQDKYWIWINDACAFPSGQQGVYGRIKWTRELEGTAGVAVMPLLSDGRVVLNLNFRHATRSWEIELPKGLVEPGETTYEAAQRETLEETGMVVDNVRLLGEMVSDSGVAGTLVPVFVARVTAQQAAHQEDSEAIAEVFALTMDEIKEAFKAGFYRVLLNGETRAVPFRDPFLAYALLLYELKPGFETRVGIYSAPQNRESDTSR